MLIKKLVSVLIILCLSMTLVSCEVPAEYQGKINQVARFQRTHYVYETSDWRQALGANRFFLEDVNSQYSIVNAPTPSLSDYLNHKNSWSKWRNDGSTTYRIVGVIDSTMSYRLDSAQFAVDSTTLKITVVTGPFAGMKFYLGGHAVL